MRDITWGARTTTGDAMREAWSEWRSATAIDPIPVVPPVTKATFPFKTCVYSSLFLPGLGLAVYGFHHCRVIPRSLDGLFCQNLVQISQVGWGDLELRAADVFLQPVNLGGARNRNNPRLLCQ
jgi:hypothetical protein